MAKSEERPLSKGDDQLVEMQLRFMQNKVETQAKSLSNALSKDKEIMKAAKQNSAG